jgi:hypothetical protein
MLRSFQRLLTCSKQTTEVRFRDILLIYALCSAMEVLWLPHASQGLVEILAQVVMGYVGLFFLALLHGGLFRLAQRPCSFPQILLLLMRPALVWLMTPTVFFLLKSPVPVLGNWLLSLLFIASVIYYWRGLVGIFEGNSRQALFFLSAPVFGILLLGFAAMYLMGYFSKLGFF